MSVPHEMPREFQEIWRIMDEIIALNAAFVGKAQGLGFGHTEHPVQKEYDWYMHVYGNGINKIRMLLDPRIYERGIYNNLEIYNTLKRILNGFGVTGENHPLSSAIEALKTAIQAAPVEGTMAIPIKDKEIIIDILDKEEGKFTEIKSALQTLKASPTWVQGTGKQIP